ncbi:hypothetical protein FRC10_006038 [Ceratobasidium sp. 414]|nr:hypothetical protein FRC10_006038 [Ceratobasidium sp. 414]
MQCLEYPVENAPPGQHNSIAEQSPAVTPFLDHNTRRPVLPPILSLLGSVAQVTATLYPQTAAHPSSTYGGAPAPIQHITTLGGYSDSTATYSHGTPAHPIGHPPRPAPFVGHIRTSSIASSAGYDSSAGYSHPAQLSGLVASGGSSDVVLTPGNSNTGQSAWQPVTANPCNVESSRRSVSGMGPPPQPPPPPPATASTRGSLVGPMPPPVLATPQVPQRAAAPTQAPAIAPTASHIYHSGPTPNSDAHEQGNKAGDTPKTQAIPKVIRAGGAAYVDEAECGHPHKNWCLYEDGFMLMWFCNPKDNAVPECQEFTLLTPDDVFFSWLAFSLLVARSSCHQPQAAAHLLIQAVAYFLDSSSRLAEDLQAQHCASLLPFAAV